MNRRESTTTFPNYKSYSHGVLSVNVEEKHDRRHAMPTGTGRPASPQATSKIGDPKVPIPSSPSRKTARPASSRDGRLLADDGIALG